MTRKPEQLSHGSAYTYRQYMCRCQECREAHTVENMPYWNVYRCARNSASMETAHNHKRPWSEVEDNAIRAGDIAPNLARKLGRSIFAVQARRRRLL